MATNESIIHKYLSDMVAVVSHCGDTIAWQAEDKHVQEAPARVREVVTQAHGVLKRHESELKARLDAVGSSATIKDAVAAVTSFMTGIFGKVRFETASRMLRDDHTALNFVCVVYGMLYTTATACGDRQTAELVQRLQREIPPLILAFGELLPEVVVADLQKDDNIVLANPNAANEARQVSREAWGQAMGLSAR